MELVQSCLTIEQRIGIRPVAFAVPFGQSNNWNATAQRLAQEAGYRRVYAQSAIKVMVKRAGSSVVPRATTQGRVVRSP